MVFEILKIGHFDDEVMEVAAHYYTISPDLYSRFYIELNIALNKLEENPFAYFNLKLKPFRRIVLRSFPFAIIFRVEECIGIISTKR